MASGLVNGGADSGFSERFAAKTIKLPEGMVPGIYAPLTPTSFDIGFKASGFDVPGAAQEWFANAHIEGDGPMMPKEAQAKVMARLVRGKPIVVDILPSRIIGPSLNLVVPGQGDDRQHAALRHRSPSSRQTSTRWRRRFAAWGRRPSRS